MKGNILRAAALQTRPVFGDVETNVAGALALADRVTPAAALYVFPELMTSGYAFASRAEARALAETPGARPGHAPGLHALAAWAKAKRAHVIAGFPEKDGARVYNSAALIGPDGRLKDVYRKLHLFDDEKLWFAPGDRAPRVSRVGPARVGMLVCFDWRFPEVWRALALAGADVIAHPSNLVVPRAAQQATLVRALENKVYIVTANRVGEDVRPDRRIAFTGRSQIASPDGGALVKAGARAPLALAVDLDLAQARDKSFAGRNDIFADRRPEFYGPLTSPKNRR
ncbi:MAG: nitrilase-related carbon-nitrogen hydrolase [Candidatus Eisenbacteria bacterium]